MMRIAFIATLLEHYLRLALGVEGTGFHAANVAAMQEVRCGRGAMPSWRGQPDRTEQFWSGVPWLSSRRNIPFDYVARVTRDPLNRQRMLELAGALEQRRARFAAQQWAVADLITERRREHLRAGAIAERV